MAGQAHSDLVGVDLHVPFHYIQSSDPGAVGAGKYWLDTTSEPYLLYVRNGTDTDWVQIAGSASGSFVDLTSTQTITGLKTFDTDLIVTNIYGPSAPDDTPPPNMTIYAASATGTSGGAPGAGIDISGGNGAAQGNQGGVVSLGGGNGGAGTVDFDGGTGGGTTIYSGFGGAGFSTVTGGGDGGDIIITASSGGSAGGAQAPGDGGDVIFQSGSKGGGGGTGGSPVDGTYKFRKPGTSLYAILNTSSIATSDKTFTFPNNSGTLALTSDIPVGLTDGDKGDITVSSSGTVWTIDNSVVTLAKIANASANSVLLGSGATGSGSAYTQITLGTNLSMSGTTLNATGAGYTDEQAQDAVGAMIDSSLVYVDATPLLTRAALTGDVTASQGSNSTTIANDAVTLAKIQNAVASSKLLGSGASGAGSDYVELTLGTNLSMSGTTLNATGSGGITVGDPVTGGGAGRVLWIDPSNNLAATGNFVYDNTTGVAIGKKLTLTSTTEQQRWEYDSSNYATITVDSSGNPTFNAASGFILTGYHFTPKVLLDGGATVTGTTTTDNLTVNTSVTVPNTSFTLAKLQNATANSKLLGSGATGSGAAYTEITLGTNLSMSGTTLNAAGGSGSPGGSSTQLQYNNSSAFGGVAPLTYNGTTVFSDVNNTTFHKNGDTTTGFTFDTSALTGSTIRSYTVPDNSGTLALLSDISGTSGIVRVVTVTSGNYTAGSTVSTDYVYLIAGAHTTTLPTASGNSDRYTFKNNHSANVTINRAGADTIEGATSLTLGVGEAIDLISDGTSAWYVL